MASGRSEVWAAIRDTTTVVPSILVYGLVWGGLARQAGLSVAEALVMCLLVSAGTAQLVALPMLSAGAPAALLVVTTYIVNLRHYLMAASLAPHFARVPRRWLLLLAHGVTDEVYALSLARWAHRPAHPAYFAGSAACAYGAWYVGATGGALLGGRIPDPQRFGLDFVFPAVFLAILGREVRAPWQWLVAGTAAAIALPVAWALGGTWHIALAGLTASLIGVRLVPRLPPAASGAPARPPAPAGSGPDAGAAG